MTRIRGMTVENVISTEAMDKTCDGSYTENKTCALNTIIPVVQSHFDTLGFVM